MTTPLNPEEPQAVAGDTPLPDMPTVDELAKQLEARLLQLKVEIAGEVAAQKKGKERIARGRVEAAKIERLLRATKPRGSK